MRLPPKASCSVLDGRGRAAHWRAADRRCCAHVNEVCELQRCCDAVHGRNACHQRTEINDGWVAVSKIVLL